MKQIINNVLTSVPPYVLFLLGFGSMVAIGLVKLHGMLQNVL